MSFDGFPGETVNVAVTDFAGEKKSHGRLVRGIERGECGSASASAFVGESEHRELAVIHRGKIEFTAFLEIEAGKRRRFEFRMGERVLNGMTHVVPSELRVDFAVDRF